MDSKRKFYKLVDDTAPLLGGSAFLIAFNAIINNTGRGWLSWAVALPALVIIALTAAARVYDISERGKRWFVRRMGLILAGASSGAVAVSPILGYSLAFPSWYTVALLWGFALTWLTTPHMPPWYRYISGEYKLDKGQQP